MSVTEVKVGACGYGYTAATAIDGHVLPRRYILPQGIRHWEVRPTAWFATLAGGTKGGTLTGSATLPVN